MAMGLRIVLDVAYPVPEVDGSKVGEASRPVHHLPQNSIEGLLPEGLPAPQGRRILSEALGYPAIAVRLRGDAVAPPLVGEFMREKEVGKIVEGRGVVLEPAAHQERSLLQDDQAGR